MKRAARLRTLAAGLLGLALLGEAKEAAADGFTVKPTRVVLNASRANEIVSIRNDGTAAVRLQLSAFRWSQGPGGDMKLTDTKDVIFFPPFLTLGAGEERKVRIGASVPFGTIEKSYRLFVEELPPLHKSGKPQAGIAVLTKMGVPIFLQPEEPASKGELRLSLRSRVLVASVRNAGNAYMVPGAITLRGRGANGAVLFEKALTSWYVLAGGRRDFGLQLDSATCKRASKIELEAEVGGKTLSESLSTGAASCGP